MLADCCQRHVRRNQLEREVISQKMLQEKPTGLGKTGRGETQTYCALAVELQVVFGLQGVGVQLVWGWLGLDSFGNICKNLLGAEHAVGVKTRAAVHITAASTSASAISIAVGGRSIRTGSDIGR